MIILLFLDIEEIFGLHLNEKLLKPKTPHLTLKSNKTTHYNKYRGNLQLHRVH